MASGDTSGARTSENARRRPRANATNRGSMFAGAIDVGRVPGCVDWRGLRAEGPRHSEVLGLVGRAGDLCRTCSGRASLEAKLRVRTLRGTHDEHRRYTLKSLGPA